MFCNLSQQIFEVIIRFQIIRFGGFRDTINNGTGFGSMHGINRMPVGFAYAEDTNCLFPALLPAGTLPSVRNTLRYFS